MACLDIGTNLSNLASRFVAQDHAVRSIWVVVVVDVRATDACAHDLDEHLVIVDDWQWPFLQFNSLYCLENGTPVKLFDFLSGRHVCLSIVGCRVAVDGVDGVESEFWESFVLFDFQYPRFSYREKTIHLL